MIIVGSGVARIAGDIGPRRPRLRAMSVSTSSSARTLILFSNSRDPRPCELSGDNPSKAGVVRRVHPDHRLRRGIDAWR